MGLGSVNENNGLYLSVAGGFIWNRKAEESDPDYATQEYTKGDKTTGVRKGARYADLTGYVKNVVFKTHKEYGESINVTIESQGESYILSVSTNNKYSQDLMKALLKINLKEELFLSPYDFIDDSKKRVQGISFRQNGEKIDLKVDTPDEFQKDKSWFKEASSKEIRRFFEDLSDWFVSEVEEKVIPRLDAEDFSQKNDGNKAPEQKEQPDPAGTKPKKAATEKNVSLPTPLKMKKALKTYIEENYPGKELPDNLSKEELINWYELSQAFEELPFNADPEKLSFEEGSNDNDTPESEDDGDLDSQLDALMG